MTRARAVPYVLVTPLLFLALSRWLAHDQLLPLVWASSVTPILYLPAYPLLGLAVVKRRMHLGALSLFVVASHVFWVVPSLVPSEPAPDGTPLRVVTANLLAVNTDPARLLAELMSMDADVLLLQEVSPRWAVELEDVADYPHRLVEVSDDAFGIAILSRRPMRSVELVDLSGVPMVDARIEHEGQLVRVLGVHTLPPYSVDYAGVWRTQLSALTRAARDTHGPLVIAGDLNATTHHAGFEALVDEGMADVHEALGRGLTTTWPNGVFPLPPLRLDHVLVSPHLRPASVHEGRGQGSDHQPVVVDLVLRRQLANACSAGTVSASAETRSDSTTSPMAASSARALVDRSAT